MTLLASLLILALLLCHGAMGGFHQLAPHLATDAPGTAAVPGQALGHADHAPAAPESGPDGGRQAPGFYLAALLVVLLVLVYGPASRGAAPLSVPASWASGRPPPAAFSPGRPPTASSLQVFRL